MKFDDTRIVLMICLKHFEVQITFEIQELNIINKEQYSICLFCPSKCHVKIKISKKKKKEKRKKGCMQTKTSRKH